MDLNSTADEAYGMSYSIALSTLNKIMTGEDESASVADKIFAAEAILENPPKEKTNDKKH